MHANRTIGLVTAAIATEGALWTTFMLWGRIGGDGGNLVGVSGLVLHVPALVLSEALKIGSPAIEDALCVGLGSLQWFLLFSGIMWGRERLRKRSGRTSRDEKA